MRIGIGAILGVLGGPATYARELIRALARIDATNEYLIIADAPELLGVSSPNIRCVRAPLPTSFLQPGWDHVLVPYFIKRYALDLYHGTKGALPLWKSCSEVVTIHDLAVYCQPETFAWPQRIHQRTHARLALRRAARVIAPSEAGRQDILARFGLTPTQVVAIPLAPAPQFSPHPGPDDADVVESLQLGAPYILYAGTVQPRKNVEALVTAFAGLANARKVTLLIAGRLRPGYRPSFLREPPPGVRYLGPVPDAVLPVLYRHALALCSPSSYEGFGLSLVEAMASGCLVIAGRNSAIPELVDDCSLLLESLAPSAIRAALQRVLDDDDASLADLRMRARARAANYTWEDTARKTLQVYGEVS